MSIHPKAGAAGLFAAAGILIVAILNAAGVDVTTGLASAISGFSAALGAWLVPAGETPGVPVTVAQTPAREPTDTVTPEPTLFERGQI